MVSATAIFCICILEVTDSHPSQVTTSLTFNTVCPHFQQENARKLQQLAQERLTQKPS
jgi:hypothetical protein